ncbi:MAG: CoA transferase, partial [Terricaulis silvestris]
ALTAALAPVLATRPSADWIAALEAANVPCGPINTLDQVFTDPQVLARNMVETMTREDGEQVRLMASPLRLEKTPPRAELAPPLMGQDTRAVLGELLGATEADCAAWAAAGAI